MNKQKTQNTDFACQFCYSNLIPDGADELDASRMF